VQFRCNRRQGECAPVSPPEVPAAGVAEVRCCYCSVQHMGEHAIALRFASWRLCTARNTPKECTPATLRTPASVRRRPSRDHPPPEPPLLPVSPLPPDPPSDLSLRVAESGSGRGTRGISANSMLAPVSRGRGMRGRFALRGRFAARRLNGGRQHGFRIKTIECGEPIPAGRYVLN